MNLQVFYDFVPIAVLSSKENGGKENHAPGCDISTSVDRVIEMKRQNLMSLKKKSRSRLTKTSDLKHTEN